MKKLLWMLILLFPALTQAQQSEKLMLSGQGLGDTQTWDFWVSRGMNSQKWSQIEVPSQWELEGFGEYSYGRWYVKRPPVEPDWEYGIYRRTFEVPASWRGKTISVVFEGVMTDTEVKVNGKLAGPIHQGGFYRFSYDITDKLKPGRENTIEVTVHKNSANRSVNAAERRADWWTFGGIYRPVYLTAVPKQHIERIAVDPRHDGTFNAEVFTSNLPEGYTIAAAITPVGGGERTPWKTFPAAKNSSQHQISTQWEGVKSWDPEHPNLYRLDLELRNLKGETVHAFSERIGFRTVEFRPRDGVYVNGVKVRLKGINRHSFHPDGGRTTNRETSLQDVKLMKEMNMNAVRFHYPPDVHFLEMCDSLGLFVLDELAGWQNSYDTEVGLKLQREFMIRDVNHPSIIIWNSGNEGGWNYDLDAHFADYDPQKRHVIHPWADFDNFDTHHYPEYLTGVARFNNGYKLFMPTETMHGSYDEGHGAGLEDFWNKWSSHPLFVGAFMWDFSDNAVRRSDRNGELDSDGSNAVDGILGPYREKEGSYWAVREIWAPVKFDKLFITPSFDGKFLITNDYLYTHLDRASMSYEVLKIDSPLKGASSRVIASGPVQLPPLAPQEKGFAAMALPANFFDGDVLQVKAFHPDGREMCNWTWSIKYADEYFATQQQPEKAGSASVQVDGDRVKLSASGVEMNFDAATGLITTVKNAKGKISLTNGPVAVGLNSRYTEYKAYQQGNEAVFTAYYLGAIDSIQWRMTPDGMVSMRAVMLNRGNGGRGFDDAIVTHGIYNLGLTFSYPEEKVNGIEWFGKGPYRVWKNRIPGANYGLWEKPYNNTVTGESYGDDYLLHPEFKGYHANMYWLTLQNDESPFTVYSESDGVYARIFTPQEPKKPASKSLPEFPEGDISFLYEIPAIKSFKPIPQQGPQSQPGSIRIKIGDEGIKMNLWFDFR